MFAPTFVASTVCATEGVHTLTTYTHIFLVYIHRGYTSNILRRFHTCTAQGCLQCACRHLSVISPSPFSCFTRFLLLLFLDGHFETFPDLAELTDVSVRAILPNFSLKAQVKRTPHEDEEFVYLADSTHSTRGA